MKRICSLIFAVLILVSLLASCSNAPAQPTEPQDSTTAVDTPVDTTNDAAQEEPVEEPQEPAEEPQEPAEEPQEPAEEPEQPAEEPVDTQDLNEMGFPAGYAPETMPYPICELGDVTLEYWRSIDDPILQRPGEPFSENLAYAKAEEITGVQIEWNIMNAQTFAQQYSLMLVSEEYPDIAYGGTYTGGADAAIDDGVYVDLAPYAETHAPNYMRWVNLNAGNRKNSRTDSGYMPYFGLVYDHSQPSFAGCMIRQNWLDDLNLEMPDTVDEWHDVLVAFRDNKTGGVAPFDLSKDGFTSMNFLEGAFNIASMQTCGLVVVDGEIQSSFRFDTLRQYLETISQWYKENLINRDFPAQGWRIDADRLANDENGITGGMYTNAGYYYANLNMCDPATYWALMPLPTADGIERHVYNKGEFSTGLGSVSGGTSVFASSDYVEEAIRWLDFWYSEEGYMLSNYGIEGTTFEYDENGEIKLCDGYVLNNPDNLSTSVAQALYLVHNGPCVLIVARDEMFADEAGLKYNELWDNYGDWNISGSISMTVEEGEAMGTMATDIDTYVDEFCVKVIAGEQELNDESWNNFQEQLTKMGMDEVIAIQQAAYDRFLAR